MKNRLSVVIITQNNEDTIEKTLQSVKKIASEIVIVDSYSTDKTVEIVKKYQAKVFYRKYYDIGEQKTFGVEKTKCDWILILDSDEVILPSLSREIDTVLKNKKTFSGYSIPFQTHFLGKPLKFGGERYSKLILYKKNKGVIKPTLIHDKVTIIDGKVGCLKNKAYHYSYRSLSQFLIKFTQYAVASAKQKKANKEKTSLKKIFLYPLHMFYARFIKDKGYKDGIFRIPLDLGFAYMEFVTYFLMIFI